MSENENPIHEAPTVTVYLWEYAKLVAANARLNIIEDMTKKLDNYDLKKYLNVLFDREDLQD